MSAKMNTNHPPPSLLKPLPEKVANSNSSRQFIEGGGWRTPPPAPIATGPRCMERPNSVKLRCLRQILNDKSGSSRQPGSLAAGVLPCFYKSSAYQMGWMDR